MGKCDTCRHRDDFWVCDTCVNDKSMKDNYEPVTKGAAYGRVKLRNLRLR